MKAAGLGPRKNLGFTPHVTLTYNHRHIAEQAIEPITWTVREFALLRSVFGKGQHIQLGRWELKC